MAKNTVKTSALQMFNSIKKPEIKQAPQEKEVEESAVVEEAMNAPTVPEIVNVAVSEPSVAPATDIVKVDMSGFRARRKARAGRTVSFYVKEDVYAKLASLAEAQGASLSECLDYVLRTALLG